MSSQLVAECITRIRVCRVKRSLLIALFLATQIYNYAISNVAMTSSRLEEVEEVKEVKVNVIARKDHLLGVSEGPVSCDLKKVAH